MRQNVVQKQSTTRFLAQLGRSLHHAVYFFNIFPPLSPFLIELTGFGSAQKDIILGLDEEIEETGKTLEIH
ncbi:hypothetical protein NC653_004323 [Populus alba x Populus x berolinensis]|uniref:Uncharacterized protein n=1 Tax=Populus alba x Populus x berolinensis TaxID=444605 RepID=A0AAD6WJ87_9ROSI|nr:hypothetical protein NC653_004323 [Populus alba x Populus x berolinensis]